MPLTPEEEIELIRLLEMEEHDKLFRPQPGPQTAFLNTTADIALYGGAAGGGKTWALLLECMRHVSNPEFGAVIFRRETTQITAQGGLWDTARRIYPLRGGNPKSTPHLQFSFPSGAKITFRHLQHEDTVLDWQGSQLPLQAFDELTHFSRGQFFYMLSRARSTCGVPAYVRATTNPDADSWVAEFIEWWIEQAPGDPRYGLAIPERSGVVRFFVMINDVVRWADTPDELVDAYGVVREHIKSFTFIASSIYDNPILLDAEPGYLGYLNALDAVQKARLLEGNWKIRPAAGLYFPRSKVIVVTAIPGKLVSVARAWDLAATERSATNRSPDATSGVLMGRLENGKYIILDVAHGCWSADVVRATVLARAEADRLEFDYVMTRLPQDPGQAGKSQARSFITELGGYPVKTLPVSGDKVTRAEPLSSQWQAGNIYVLQRDWTEAYLTEMDAFPTPGVHDDDPDASADAFAEVAMNSAPVVEIQMTTYEDLLGSGSSEDLFYSMS